MRAPIPIPAGLDVTTHPVALPPELAPVLQRVDLAKPLGRIKRGRGQARSSVPAQTTSVTAAVVFERRDCRKALVDGSKGGTWRLVNAPAGLGNACVGPLPEYLDYDPEEDLSGAVRVTQVDSKLSTGTVIWKGVTSGKTYRVTALGWWRWLPSVAWHGPAGDHRAGARIVSGPFVGFKWGEFVIQEPGAGSWVAGDDFKEIVATGAGDLLGVFADQDVWNDNAGFMTVIVEEL